MKNQILIQASDNESANKLFDYILDYLQSKDAADKFGFNTVNSGYAKTDSGNLDDFYISLDT